MKLSEYLAAGLPVILPPLKGSLKLIKIMGSFSISTMTKA